LRVITQIQALAVITMHSIKYIILLIGLFACKQSNQKKEEPFHLTRTIVQEIDKLESFDSLKAITHEYTIGVSEDYFPGRTNFSLAQPIIYGKRDGTFDFEKEYFYSNNDSIVRLIVYQWGGTDSTSELIFSHKVEENKRIITSLLGFPGREIPETEDLAAKTIWSTHEVNVEQFHIPTRLIRVLISWPNYR
jgi:hypothetical protein